MTQILGKAESGQSRELPSFLSQTSDKSFSTDESVEQKAAEKLLELAHCRLSYIVVFSLLSPIVSYSYTGRFKALCFFTALVLLGFVWLSRAKPELDLQSKEAKTILGISLITSAVIDNTQSVLRARKKVAVATVSIEPSVVVREKREHSNGF